VVCEGAACPDPDAAIAEWRLVGAARMGEVLLPALVEGFALDEGYAVRREEDGPLRFDYVLADQVSEADRLRLEFRLSDTDGGFADLLSGRADVAMAVREIRPAERQAALDAGLGDLGAPDRARIVALDGLVPVVSAAQERAEIDIAHLAAAFAGEIRNWSEIGGPDLPLSLHLPPADEGHVQGFVDRVVRLTGGELAPGVVHHSDATEVAAVVAGDPGALGVLPYRLAGDARPLAISGSCGRAIMADLQSLKTEDYPLTMPLFLYLPERRLPPVAEKFVAWLRGERAQFIVRRAGFADLGAEPIPVAAQGERFAAAIAEAGPEVGLADLQRMVRTLGTRQRLSTTFRFELGSTRLDAQSRSNVYQLAREILDGVHDGDVLMLAGFSDGVGPAVANQGLAAARAETVLRALVTALGGALPQQVRVRTVAFGEAMPMGCDDTEWGRQINRRVELWVEG
jgi:phosphate transport system substrate-binding protein